MRKVFGYVLGPPYERLVPLPIRAVPLNELRHTFSNRMRRLVAQQLPRLLSVCVCVLGVSVVALGEFYL